MLPRTGTCHTACTRGRTRRAYETKANHVPSEIIVCPLDFSEASMRALESACELSSHFGAELCLVRVVPDLLTLAGVLIAELRFPLQGAVSVRCPWSI